MSIRLFELARTAFLVLVLSVLWGASGEASWVAPDRPITPEEKLAGTIAECPLVAIGHMISVYDTTVVRDPSGVGLGTIAVVTFEPTRTLKGRSPGRQFRFVLWMDAHFTSQSRAGTRGQTFDVRGDRLVLVCFQDLHDSERAPERTMLGASQRISRWATSESASPYSVPRLADWSASYERQIRQAIARQAPEALARRSSQIVLARAPLHPFPGPQPWTVERTVKGPATRRVQVRVVAPSNPEVGPRALLFLRKVGGLYEPTDLYAGVVSVRGDRVPSWNCSLEEAIARVSR
jgi:hypothetical protein